jgi:hypothetical protein
MPARLEAGQLRPHLSNDWRSPRRTGGRIRWWRERRWDGVGNLVSDGRVFERRCLLTGGHLGRFDTELGTESALAGDFRSLVEGLTASDTFDQDDPAS